MTDSDAESAVRSLAGDLTDRWLRTGEIPDDAVEGTVPALRDLLDGGIELSFDDFQHKHHVRPDWGFAQFAPPDFSSPFELYLPTSAGASSPRDPTATTCGPFSARAITRSFRSAKRPAWTD